MTHIATDNWDIRGGELYLGGQSCESLLSENADTPVYVYSRAKIEARIELLRRVIDPRIHLHYAVKANPNKSVVDAIAGLVDGLDVASAMELELALQTTCDPAEISMAGPGKSARDIELSISNGSTLNVESPNELVRITEYCRANQVKARVAFRVNPDFELKSSGMKMSGGPKQFGIDAEQISQVAGLLDPELHEFRGFHIFCGSQNLQAQSICETQIKSFELARSLAEQIGEPAPVVNIGGGFGIPYFPGEQPLDLTPITENLRMLADRAEREMPDTRLVLELGRFIVAEAGYYLCRVIDKKVSRGSVFIVTNGGLHHHLAASGNFGQVLRKNYPVFVANRMNHEHTERATVVGPLCTPLDLLADRMELPVMEVGDIVVVAQSGAYGFTASPLAFLSHPAPVEILV